MGSSDRRMNSRYCYNYFRLGNAFKDQSKEIKLLIAEFLCEDESVLVLALQPTWANRLNSSLDAKIAFIESIYGLFLNDVFPVTEEFSENINPKDFIKSHFIQPDLFIRIQRNKESIVKEELSRHNIDFTDLGNQTLVLSNGTNLQQLSRISGNYEVQDLSSQKTIDAIDAKPNESWWDCCAASGGKALMLLDKYPQVKLLVSDVRLSILRNLDERFEIAKIKNPYRKKILDLSNPVDHLMNNEKFDGILIDAPCSGSGTWGRTPEMLSKFQSKDLDHYPSLQRKIVSNVVQFLKPGKSLVYITCSVFQKENEEVADYIVNNLGLQLEYKSALIGYDKKADSMFYAKFIKP